MFKRSTKNDKETGKNLLLSDKTCVNKELEQKLDTKLFQLNLTYHNCKNCGKGRYV